MNVDPADGNIDFRVGPRSRPTQSKGYGTVLVALLGVSIVILVIIVGLQQQHLNTLQGQISDLTEKNTQLAEKNSGLQKSLDDCRRTSLNKPFR